MAGGKRPGAGRPVGSKNIPCFRDYISDDERKRFVEFVLSTYMEGERLTTWMGDQLFGKAVQQLELTGPEGAPLEANLSASDREAINSLRDLLKQRAA
jgi:hypothetical protein